MLQPPVPRRDTMKFGGEVVEIVEAFDLTGSYRDAAELVGCSPTTVAHFSPTAPKVGTPLSCATARPGPVCRAAG